MDFGRLIAVVHARYHAEPIERDAPESKDGKVFVQFTSSAAWGSVSELPFPRGCGAFHASCSASFPTGTVRLSAFLSSRR